MMIPNSPPANMIPLGGFVFGMVWWNCAKTKPMFLWLSEHIDTYTDDGIADMPSSIRALMEDNSPEIRRFTLNLLRNADINIDDYKISAHRLERPAAGGASKSYLTLYDVRAGHTMPDGRQYELNFKSESLGTQNLFTMSPLLYNALASGKALFVDEMSCLHTELVKYLVGLFHDKELNKKGAQLIFATHDTNLQDLKIFRRDQIYFIEKHNDGVSDLYSLCDFSVRKNENIRAEYLIGRFGAVPNIREGELL